ncbi:uncharacterized protein LTR77_007949 [Saxophila tyrrhenica]|uniref:Uncharacterized protein n=1 Tax=Saxophila tyrrhenica TaxID=1690608 RepID=A0AAV9P6U0_9PEZI|nr:hypothetical protein LTR77_007949 [Saxophila tyrrhenica]
MYITGVRAGSFTVGVGYEKGADLSGGFVRPDDETLRWSDVKFFHYPNVDGVAVSIKYKYLKGQRNPYTQRAVEAKKTFTFLPTRGERYEFDLSAVLLAIAFNRGLFPFSTIEDLLADERVNLPTIDAVSKQAVFLASNQASELEPTQPMRIGVLNPKLRKMCTAVGLLQRNTTYSFRRTAIVEMRRSHGTERARELAGHAIDSTTISYYDEDTTEDMDITAMRTGEQTISRDAIREAFRQAHTRIDTQGIDLQQELRERTANSVTSDPTYIDMEQKLFSTLTGIAEILEMDPPELQKMTNFQQYRDALVEKSLFSEHEELTTLLAKRKKLRYHLMERHLKEQKAQMLEDHKKTMKAYQDSSEALIQGLSTDEVEEDSAEADIDAEAVEEALEATREEPEHWGTLNDEVFVRSAGDQDGNTTVDGRLQFLKSFIALSSVEVKNMKCMLCLLDPTAATPDRLWDKTKLDRHMRSDYHSRQQELLRAAINSQEDGRVICPLCKVSILHRKFAKHVESTHLEHV